MISQGKGENHHKAHQRPIVASIPSSLSDKIGYIIGIVGLSCSYSEFDE